MYMLIFAPSQFEDVAASEVLKRGWISSEKFRFTYMGRSTEARNNNQRSGRTRWQSMGT